MVPADDEHKSANEAEKNTSTQKNFVAKLKFWDRDKKDADEPARLKTLPKYLMHWLTPVWIAAAGFLFALAFAVIWRGELHWPSAEAMKLCATIAGAGFAFSAWQQRSHDNAVRDDDKLDRERAAAQARAEREEQRGLEETRRLEQIERDEYWKRREQIYQLLGSENPGLRLGAVALLAELADKAAQSEQLNKTEQQQLQRHIIDTLCLQLRHEGIDRNGEGTISERAQIQEAIFETILTRIELPGDESPYADWSRESINITSCVVHTPVYITNLTTHATIDLSQSKFLGKFELNNANIPALLWEQAYFINELITRNNSIIGIKSLPLFAPFSIHTNTTFIHDSRTFSITLKSYTNCSSEPTITLSKCKFTTEAGKTETCTPLQIYTSYKESTEEEEFGQNLDILHCQLADITIDATYIHSRISIAENNITGRLQIDLAEQSNEDGILERTPHASDRIQLRSNVIHPGEDEMPIVITNHTDANIANLIYFYNNRISRDNAPEEFHTLRHEILTDNPKPFIFLEITSAGNVAHRWKTGGGHEDLDLFSDSIFITDNV